jgi:archaemetzincin
MRINVAPIRFANSELTKRVVETLGRLFRFPVDTAALELDLDAAFSKERNQYYSTKLIADALGKTGDLEGKVLMLVDFDLYVPVFTFLFGEAQLEGKHSIVSVCRLHEEFYTGKTDDEALFQRTMKEALHELGHNFGLVHCKDWNCVMHTSRGVEEIDVKGAYYCDRCAERVPGFVKSAAV